MRLRLAVSVVSLAAAAVAAARKPQKPVLLGPDPPGRLRKASADAGAGDAGPTPGQRLDALEAELAAVKRRLDALEARRAADRADAQELRALGDEVRALKASLQAGSDGGAAEAGQQNESRAEVEDAAQGLRAAQQRLLSGDESGVLDAIAEAQEVFPPAARMHLGSAQEALRNRDLAAARAALAAALAQLRY